jgi:hypothetical protein
MKALQPDSPASFGYKCAWLAIRDTDTMSVVRALALRDPEPSTWAAGVRAVYAGKVFVTPPLGPWVLAASISLPDSGDANTPDLASPLLARLGRLFSEVQYFGTHRVVEWHAWGRVVSGTLVRKFAFVGDQGVVAWNEGSPTPEEISLGLSFTPEALEEGSFPDESNVMALAGLWSIDPSVLEDQGLEPGLRVVGSLPV